MRFWLSAMVASLAWKDDAGVGTSFAAYRERIVLGAPVDADVVKPIPAVLAPAAAGAADILTPRKPSKV
jgi:hypothetical protein